MKRSRLWGQLAGLAPRGVTRIGGAVALGALLGACASEDWVAPPGSIPDPPPPMAAAATPPAPVVSPPPPRATVDPIAQEILEQHRHHHHGGVTMFIAMSLDTLAVAPAERPEVEKIQAVLADRMAVAQDAERKVLATLADGVQAGTVDPAKVDAQVAQLARAAGAIHAGTAAALTKLHGVLTPVERAALADKVEAHWAVWSRVNAAVGHDSPVAELTEALQLTQDQADRIRSAVGAMPALASLDTKEVEGHIRAFATAFAGAEPFGAKTASLGSTDDARLASVGATYMARFCEAAAPLLTPEQRSKLAAHLREHLDHSDAPVGT